MIDKEQQRVAVAEVKAAGGFAALRRRLATTNTSTDPDQLANAGRAEMTYLLGMTDG